jgi:LysM repeat protein
MIARAFEVAVTVLSMAAFGSVSTTPAQAAGIRVAAFHYTVVTGDSPSSLAAKWGVPPSLVAAQGATLKAGDVITIQLRARVKIGRNEALWNVCKRYKVPLETVGKFNNVPPPYHVRRGQIVLIPLMPTQPKAQKPASGS